MTKKQLENQLAQMQEKQARSLEFLEQVNQGLQSTDPKVYHSYRNLLDEIMEELEKEKEQINKLTRQLAQMS